MSKRAVHWCVLAVAAAALVAAVALAISTPATAGEGEGHDPVSGQGSTRRSVTTLPDDDHDKVEMYKAGPDRKDLKTMEFTATRN